MSSFRKTFEGRRDGLVFYELRGPQLLQGKSPGSEVAKRSWDQPGTRCSKLPVITGPVKLFCLPFQMRVSKGLKIVQ